jgi:hypothetical protein
LANNVLDPSANAQQPEHSDFSPTLWDRDADGVKGPAGRLEQLCVHAVPAKQSATPVDEVRPPVWLGRVYQLQCQLAGTASNTKGSWQRGH